MAFLQTLPTSTRLIAQYLAIFLDSALLHSEKVRILASYHYAKKQDLHNLSIAFKK